LLNASASTALGWGTGTWGSGTWNTARSTGSVTLELTIWSLELWGEDLIATVNNNKMYHWDASGGVTGRASVISNAPIKNRFSIISFPDRHLVSMGAYDSSASAQDPMLVAFSTQGDFNNWTVSTSTTAGSQRLQLGTKIMAAVSTREEIFIGTDEAMYGMAFVGPPFTFAFRLLGTGCGPISQRCMVNESGTVFWMARENFYAYTGKVDTVPCTVLRYVFDDINLSQKYKFFAASNRMFNEVIWFYASSASDEIDRYAKFNYLEGTWDIGSLSRTAWIDYGVNDYPRAAGTASSSNYIYNHELGDTDDGSAMTSFIESADFDLDPAGEQFMFLTRLIPDIDITTDTAATVDYIIKTRDYPGDTLTTNSTNSVSSTTQQAFLRARARQAAIRIESSSTDIAWTLGDLRLEARPDGKR